MGSVGRYGKKSAVTPLVIDPETLQLAAQCLNHYGTPGYTMIRVRKAILTDLFV
jgi:hypothetical protein